MYVNRNSWFETELCCMLHNYIGIYIYKYIIRDGKGGQGKGRRAGEKESPLLSTWVYTEFFRAGEDEAVLFQVYIDDKGADACEISIARAWRLLCRRKNIGICVERNSSFETPIC